MLLELTLLALLGAAPPGESAPPEDSTPPAESAPAGQPAAPEAPRPPAAPSTPAAPAPPDTTPPPGKSAAPARSDVQGDAAPKEPEPPWTLPWKKGVRYEYTWYTKEPVGKSDFTLTWSDDNKTLLCRGLIDLAGSGTRLNGVFVSGFRPDLSPAFHASTFRGGQAGKEGSGAGVMATFAEKDVTVTLGLSKKAPVTKLAPPAHRYFLYGHQAIHHWAFFLTALDTSRPSVITVCMPDFLRFCDIAFTPEGAEELRGVATTRIAFDAGGLFQGKVWLDPEKRLLRYQQKNQTGFTDVWLTEQK